MLTSLVAQMVKPLSIMQETGFNPWVGKICWRRKWQSTPVLLPGKSHGQRRLVGNSPWGRKELDMTERLHFTILCFTIQNKSPGEYRRQNAGKTGKPIYSRKKVKTVNQTERGKNWNVKG